MKKNVLITGANGQLGYSLTLGLSDSFNIIPTAKRNFDNIIKCDITNKKDLKNIFNRYNPDIIINCAAITNVDYCEEKWSECRLVNTVGLENIIRFSHKNTKIIQISTDYVYDGLNGPYLETDATHPINLYGKSKLEAENILIGSNRKYLILRLNGLYTYDLSYNNFVSWIIGEIKNKNNIKVVSDQISNPVYVELITNVILKSILMEAEGVFNYGSSNYLSRYDLALEICSVFGFSSRFIDSITSKSLNQIAKRPKNTSLITEKIENRLGLQTYDTKYCLMDIKDKLVKK